MSDENKSNIPIINENIVNNDNIETGEKKEDENKENPVLVKNDENLNVENDRGENKLEKEQEVKKTKNKKTPGEKNIIFSKIINISGIIIFTFALISFLFIFYKGVNLSTGITDKLMVGNDKEDKTNSVIEELVEQDNENEINENV